jgi:hypothetical protein
VKTRFICRPVSVGLAVKKKKKKILSRVFICNLLTSLMTFHSSLFFVYTAKSIVRDTIDFTRSELQVDVIFYVALFISITKMWIVMRWSKHLPL